MEQKELNIAEILKDKPKGIKLWSPLFGNVTLKDADMPHAVLPILTKTELEDIQIFTKEGHFFSTYKDVECMLFPSKEMRDWEKFAWKKGDLLRAENGSLGFFDSWNNDNYTIMKIKFQDIHDNIYNYVEPGPWTKETNEDTIKQYISNIEEIKGGKLDLSTLEIEKPLQFKDGDILTFCGFIFIFKNMHDSLVYSHVSCDTDYKDCIRLNADKPFASNSFIAYFKYATEEEKQRLFDALAKKGKQWDAEKKAVVDLTNEEKKCEFQPFDKVLVRDRDEDEWEPDFFLRYEPIPGNFYAMISGAYWTQCIPYNEKTKHLLGTTKSGKKVRNESEIG